MKTPRFSVALSFLYGMIVGAFVLLAFLALTGRLDLERAAPDQIELIIPVEGVNADALRDSWGAPRGERRHGGIDIPAEANTPVVSAADARVIRVHRSRAGGLAVYAIDPGGSWLFYYAHLASFAPGIEPGRRLSRGEPIGYVGSSGNASSELPHLHFAIERLPADGNWREAEGVNPYPLLVEGKLPDDAR